MKGLPVKLTQISHWEQGKSEDVKKALFKNYEWDKNKLNLYTQQNYVSKTEV